MVKYCCICRENSHTSTDLSFHCFPRDKNRLASWFKALEISYMTHKYVYICSKHFTDDSFHFTPTGMRSLKKTAVPTEYLLNVDDHDYLKTFYELPEEPPPALAIRNNAEAPIDPLLPTSDDETPTIYQIENVACGEVIVIPDSSEVEDHNYTKTLYSEDLLSPVHGVPNRSEIPEDPLLLPTLNNDTTETPSICQDEYAACKEVIDIYDSSEDESHSEVTETTSNHSSDTLTASESEMLIREKPHGVISAKRRMRGVGGTSREERFPVFVEVDENFHAIRHRVESKTENLVSMQRIVRRLQERVTSLNSVTDSLRQRLQIVEKKKKSQPERKMSGLLLELKNLRSQMKLLKKENDELNKIRINYEPVALRNVELEMQVNSLESENRRLKSLLKHKP